MVAPGDLAAVLISSRSGQRCACFALSPSFAPSSLAWPTPPLFSRLASPPLLSCLANPSLALSPRPAAQNPGESALSPGFSLPFSLASRLAPPLYGPILALSPGPTLLPPLPSWCPHSRVGKCQLQRRLRGWGLALRSYLLASFHSDSSGRSTMPVLAALHQLAILRYPKHRLVFGLDANTVLQRPKPGSKDSCHSPPDLFQCTRSCHNFWRTSNVCIANSTTGLHAYFADLGMSSCWCEKGH